MGGRIGVVDIDTGFGGAIEASGISYAVYPGPREAERALTMWQESRRDWLETQIDVSGPELGPRAVMLTGQDHPGKPCVERPSARSSCGRPLRTTHRWDPRPTAIFSTALCWAIAKAQLRTFGHSWMTGCDD